MSLSSHSTPGTRPSFRIPSSQARRGSRRDSPIFILVKRTTYIYGYYTSWSYIILAGIPVEGKSSVCLICMKYRRIFLIIIIISLGQIFLSYIAKTSSTHARTHTYTCARTRAHTHCRRRHTGYRYSMVPNRDCPLRWRQCRSLAIEINTGPGGPVSPRFWVFFAYNKNYRPNWDSNSWQDVLSVDTNNLRHFPRRSSKLMCCSIYCQRSTIAVNGHGASQMQ